GANVAGEIESSSAPAALLIAPTDRFRRAKPLGATRSNYWPDASNAVFVLWSSSSEMAPGGQSTTTVTRYAIFKGVIE
ncbi:hypothetical protein NKI78_31715, partial [Mesorhizobium sp. M0400]|uniref:hypothetical protein n=1 Tax=Mesorhizobium sp. M0400 TaxID=2956941 RepID=UPI00333C6224